jgi:hypothetical protein
MTPSVRSMCATTCGMRGRPSPRTDDASSSPSSCRRTFSKSNGCVHTVAAMAPRPPHNAPRTPASLRPRDADGALTVAAETPAEPAADDCRGSVDGAVDAISNKKCCIAVSFMFSLVVRSLCHGTFLCDVAGWEWNVTHCATREERMQTSERQR